MWKRLENSLVWIIIHIELLHLQRIIIIIIIVAKQMQRFKLVRERGIICHQKIYQSGSFSVENSHIKGLGILLWGGAFLYNILLHTLQAIFLATFLYVFK